ncbi:MAG: hypothetical protein IPK82_36655 [Polyangiaceae bacterium]|nr:hypothetical protein [Polyangiaceae bacterium]
MDDLAALVSAILRSRRIKNRLVILCEGDLLPVGTGGPPSPQTYRRLEAMPDANFYKACVPNDWQGDRLPQFFSCGGRSQVIQVYQALLEEHRLASETSYLTPDKLYALVDLDIQANEMPEGYPWRTTEDVHATLYENGLIKGDPDAGHRIWVTALVHKEAFFFLPATEAVWRDETSAFFDGAPLALRNVHTAIAQRLTTDADLARHLHVVKKRVGRFEAGAALTCVDGDTLCTSWLAAAQSATDDNAYDGLVRALLAVAKVKPLWSKILPNPRWEADMRADHFREQLALIIGGSIAKLAPEAHPLAGFFAWLKPRR